MKNGDTKDKGLFNRIHDLLLIIGIGLLIGIAVALLLNGCDSPPPQERTTPFAVWCFEDSKALADSTGFDYLLPGPYYEPGEVIAEPSRWRVYPFKAPPRMWDHEYKFQWAAPGSAFVTLRTAAVDSMDTGMLWFAVDGIRDGDRVKLVEP